MTKKTRNELLDCIIAMLEDQKFALKDAYWCRNPWYSWTQAPEYDDYVGLELKIEHFKGQYDK